MAAKRDGWDTQNCDRPTPVPCNRETISAFMHNMQRCTQDWRGRNGRTTQNTPVACERYDQAEEAAGHLVLENKTLFVGAAGEEGEASQTEKETKSFSDRLALPRKPSQGWVCTLRPLLSNRSPNHH